MLQATSLQLEAFQYAALQASVPVEPLNDLDAGLLHEIRTILAGHNALERFGVTLLQPGFDLEGKEATYETTNDLDRVSTVAVMTVDDAPKGAVSTNWHFKNKLEAAVRGCVGWCYYNNGHRHIHNQKGPDLPQNVPGLNMISGTEH